MALLTTHIFTEIFGELCTVIILFVANRLQIARKTMRERIFSQSYNKSSGSSRWI